MGKDVIVACDFSSAEATFAFLDKFTGRKPFVKIGMELYNSIQYFLYLHKSIHHLAC